MIVSLQTSSPFSSPSSAAAAAMATVGIGLDILLSIPTAM
jgi:hypothetical protein